MRILVVRTSALGDSVLATPVLRALHERHPGSELHFVTQPGWAALFDDLPFVTQVWRWGKEGGAVRSLAALAAALRRSGPFDLAVDLQNSPKARLLVAAVRPRRAIHFVKRKTLGAVLGSLVGDDPVLDDLPAAALYLEALGPLGFPTHAAAGGEGADLVHLRVGGRSDGPAAARGLGVVDTGNLEAGAWRENGAPASGLAPIRDPVTGWDLRPAVRIPVDARARADELLAKAGAAPIVALAPGGRWATKRWPAERFAEVGDALAGEGARIVLAGGPGDAAEIRAVAAAMQAPVLADTLDLDVPGLCAVIERSSVLVSCDSAPSHLAQAVGTPVVTVFGPTSARRWGPLPGAGVAVSLPLGCAPCSNFGKRPCHLGHHACMRDLGPEAVIAAARAALRGGRMGGGAAAGAQFLRERASLALQVATTRREVNRR